MNRLLTPSMDARTALSFCLRLNLEVGLGWRHRVSLGISPMWIFVGQTTQYLTMLCHRHRAAWYTIPRCSMSMVVRCCRLFAKNILFACNEYGKRPPTFEDASVVAQAIINSGHSFDQGEIYFNTFRCGILRVVTQ